MSVKQGIGWFIIPYLSHKSTEKTQLRYRNSHWNSSKLSHNRKRSVDDWSTSTFIAGNLARVHVVALYKLSFALLRMSSNKLLLKTHLIFSLNTISCLTFTCGDAFWVPVPLCFSSVHNWISKSCPNVIQTFISFSYCSHFTRLMPSFGSRRSAISNLVFKNSL